MKLISLVFPPHLLLTLTDNSSVSSSAVFICYDGVSGVKSQRPELTEADKTGLNRLAHADIEKTLMNSFAHKRLVDFSC